jgi:hypothetical protein
MVPVLFGITLSVSAAMAASGCSSDSDSSSGSGGSSSTGGTKSTGGSSSAGGTKSTGGSSATGGSSSADSGGGTCDSPGGPATSPKDDHCKAEDGGAIVQEVGKCVTESDEADAGAEEETPGPWGGTSAADDDCKYDIKYTVTPICENEDTTFTVSVKLRIDGEPVTGAAPDLEVLDAQGIPAAEGSQTATEKSDGVYEIKGIRFTKSGKWTVRFHVFETCSDAPEDSPHGHAAFFVDVP